MNLDRVNMNHHGLDFVASQYAFCKCGWYYDFEGLVAAIPQAIENWFSHLQTIQAHYEQKTMVECSDARCLGHA